MYSRDDTLRHGTSQEKDTYPKRRLYKTVPECTVFVGKFILILNFVTQIGGWCLKATINEKYETTRNNLQFRNADKRLKKLNVPHRG